MIPEELMKPRYKVITDYPASPFKVGEIHELDKSNNGSNDFFVWEEDMKLFPHIFKPLQWWEERKIDDLLSVEYVKVVTYRGYWRVGDIVPAKFDIGSIEGARPYGYNLKYNHWQPVYELEPATKEQYENQKV